jgi:hypothetical protein
MDTVFTAIERAARPKQVVYSDFAAAAAIIFDCEVHALKGRGFFLDVSLRTASYNNRMLPAAPNRGRCSFHTEIRREELLQNLIFGTDNGRVWSHNSRPPTPAPPHKKGGSPLSSRP